MTTVSETDLTAALREVHAQITTRIKPGEFTVEIYAQANGITTKAATWFIRTGVKSGLIILVDKRVLGGHATNVYRLKPPA